MDWYHYNRSYIFYRFYYRYSPLSYQEVRGQGQLQNNYCEGGGDSGSRPRTLQQAGSLLTCGFKYSLHSLNQPAALQAHFISRGRERQTQPLTLSDGIETICFVCICPAAVHLGTDTGFIVSFKWKETQPHCIYAAWYRTLVYTLYTDLPVVEKTPTLKWHSTFETAISM